MIRFILLQNRAGKTRLAKYYIPLEESEKHSHEYDVHRLISTRDPKFTNFVEVGVAGATASSRQSGLASPCSPLIRALHIMTQRSLGQKNRLAPTKSQVPAHGEYAGCSQQANKQ